LAHVLFAALTHSTFFAVELLQENFRERWRWGIAQLGFGGTAVRECDVNNSGGNSVSATDDTAVFGGTANVDLCGLIDHFFDPTRWTLVVLVTQSRHVFHNISHNDVRFEPAAN
jgi:hypothetical protein